MSEYTKDKNEIYFLNDKSIVSSLDSIADKLNPIPSFDLLKGSYKDLSTYDINLSNAAKYISGYVDDLELSVKGLSGITDRLCSEISNDITSKYDKLTTDDSFISTEVERLCAEISNDLTVKYDKLTADDNFISGKVNSLCTDLSNKLTALELSVSDMSVIVNDICTDLSDSVEEKFIHISGDNIAWLSVANGLSTTSFRTNTSGKTIPTDQFTDVVVDEAGFKVYAIGEGRKIDLSTNNSTNDVVINGNSLSAHIKNEVEISSNKAIEIAKEYVDAEIQKLDVEDSAEEHKFVTSVSEKDGKIIVERAELVQSDIPTIYESQVSNLTADLQNLSSNYVRIEDFKTSEIDNDGKLLSAEDFNLTYNSTTHDITLKAGEKTYTFSAIEFIKSKTVHHMSIETDGEGNKWLLIYWTETDFIRLNINELVQVYNFENGISSQVLTTGGIHVGATDELARTSYVNALSNVLTAEVARATAKENTISGNVVSEVARATAKENTISGNVVSEVARAMASEAELAAAIADETTRAVGKESEISAQLISEIATRTAIDNGITADVNNISVHVDSIQNYTDALSGVGSDKGIINTLSTDILSAIDSNIRTVKQINKHIVIKSTDTFSSLSDLFEQKNIKDDYNAVKNGTIIDVSFDGIPLSSQVVIEDLSICNNEWLMVQEDDKVARINLKDLNSGNVKVVKTGVSPYEFATEIQDRIANDNFISGEVDRLCSEISNDIIAKYDKLTSDDSFISGEVDRLCSEISNDITAKYDWLSSEISGLSDEVAVISSNLCTEIGNLSDEVVVISNDLSSAISSKIWITDLNDDGSTLTSGNMDDLSVIKITKEQFDDEVGTGTLTMSSNILYVVSSDYMDAYGQVLCNLVMTDDTTPSDATNKHYVDAKIKNVDDKVENISNKVKVIEDAFDENTVINDSVMRKIIDEGNTTDLSNVISAVMYIFSKLSAV